MKIVFFVLSLLLIMTQIATCQETVLNVIIDDDKNVVVNMSDTIGKEFKILDYKLIIKKPDPTKDYKLLIKDPNGEVEYRILVVDPTSQKEVNLPEVAKKELMKELGKLIRTK